MSDYINEVLNCIKNSSPIWDDAVDRLTEELIKVRNEGGTLFFIGNGGSAGIAVHMIADYMKTGCFKTISLYDPSLLTCIANDYGYDQVFARPLGAIAQKGDVLIAISSSGNSANILNAVDIAQKRGCRIITLSGFSPDNMLRKKGEINFYIPSNKYGVVESLHNMMLQQVVDTIYDKDSKE